MLGSISPEIIIVNINVSSLISCLPPLLIAVVASVAISSFAMPQTKDHGDTIQLPIGQLHERQNLTEKQEGLQALSGKMDACRDDCEGIQVIR